MLRGGIVFEVEGRDDEEDEIHQESDDLHPLAAIELVVDQERSKVVSAERDSNVKQVVQPSGHDGGGVWGDDTDKLGLKELVAVEEDIVGEPCTCGGK